MPRETLNTRVTRLENLMVSLAEKVDSIAGKVEVLVDAQIKNEQRFREMREETDERIRQLVSAIGELIRRNGSSR